MKSVTLTPSKLNGRIEIPSSKSLCHRAIICAALAKGKSKLTNIYESDDIQTTINAVKSMGAEVK
ncbi:MAG: 3-phosphoshikimate 1-carboxyvinyltransferase, partial [Clostridia bacterium]|nr:3-phosphoshikimate 1-carboxyvinyltransferase [Clostridia bacterium]